MYSGNDENKYKKLTDDLKNLKKLKAPAGFEQNLWTKINSTETKEKKSVWNKLSIRLIPAFSVVATAVILIVVIDNSSYEYQDPFMIEPEERTDLITFSSDDIDLLESEQDVQIEQPKAHIQEKSSVRFRKKETAALEKSSAEQQGAGRSEVLKDEDSVITELLTFALSDSTVELNANEGIILPAVTVPTQQNLNFRQIQLSKEEHREVIELKSKMIKADQSKLK